MRELFTRISLCCLLCCLLGAEFVEPEASLRTDKDFALFFAVDSYQASAWTDLRNPIRDAETIAKELQEVYGFQTQVIKNPDKAEILNTLLSWQQKSFSADGQLLVFFSGHGTFSEAFTQGYFVPKDGKANDNFHNSHIALNMLGNAVTQIPCPHILLAIDACYSGTIDQKIVFRGNIFSRPGASNYDDRQPIIDLQLRNPTRLLLTSGGKARTLEGNQHSSFSNALIKVLRSRDSGSGLVLFQDILAMMERVRPTPHSGELPGHEDGGFVFISSTWNKPDTAALTSIPRPKMIRIPGGTFQMGSREEDYEQPIHQVTVGDFDLGETEVTNAQFCAFLNAKENQKEGGITWVEMSSSEMIEEKNGKFVPKSGMADHPVFKVSWFGAKAYCKWLGEDYRLPTEAEWEYAAGGGNTHRSKWSGTNNQSSLRDYGNYNRTLGNDNYPQPVPVKSFFPNQLKLYDMSGNVYEWCSDWYDSDYYSESPEHNPKGPDSGTYRVIRGGSWGFNLWDCRVNNRNFNNIEDRHDNVGFRVARQID